MMSPKMRIVKVSGQNNGLTLERAVFQRSGMIRLWAIITYPPVA
jgi:hypothetical protein